MKNKPRLIPPFKSIRFRIAALFVGIFTVTLLVLSVLVYSQFNTARRGDFDRSLYNYAVDVAHGINVGVFGDLSYDIDSFLGGGKSFPFAIGRSFIQLSRVDGSIIGKSRDLGSGHLPMNPHILSDILRDRYTFQYIWPGDLPPSMRSGHVTYRQINLLVNPGTQLSFILQIAVPMTFLEKESENLVKLFWIAIPIAILISMFGGIYLSGKAFLPIQDIIRKAQSLDPSKLDERLPLPPVEDELRALSLTLNDLLDRVQVVFQGHERFVSDASHQLKTPLSILRGELDIALQKPRSQEETRALMLSLSQELQHLSKIIDDLLLLARVDAGVAFLTRSPVRLDEVTVDAAARLEKLARQRKITLKITLGKEAEGHENPYMVYADQDLLQSMIGEIIGNAIKYSPEGKNVGVSLGERNDFYTVSVVDSGPGVSAADREKIFDRFFRVKRQGDQTEIPGSGLGLSIAKKIAQIHGGDIEYQDRAEGGSLFVISIKKF